MQPKSVLHAVLKRRLIFDPPAGAGAPADQVQGQPAEFRGTCCTPVRPEAPVAGGAPVLSGVLVVDLGRLAGLGVPPGG